ncbi:hypothetical protein GCM10028798_15950 [Humibacter antri]
MVAEVVGMAMTSLDLDQGRLRLLRDLTGAASNREAVSWAIDVAIGVEQKREAVARILARGFGPDRFENPPEATDGATR